MKRSIIPVKDNMDKANTYRDLKNAYKRAFDEEFYLEAFLLAGAMIEDRALSLLYHCGVQADRNSLDFSTAAMEKLFPEIYAKKRKHSMQGIESKTEIVLAIIKWVCETDHTPDDEYLQTVKSAFEDTDLATFQTEVKNVRKWARYRNEIIHSLYNKNMDSLKEDLPDRVKEGMRLAKYLDAQVRIIRKKGRVRKVAN
jgi:hypothetical protein